MVMSLSQLAMVNPCPVQLSPSGPNSLTVIVEEPELCILKLLISFRESMLGSDTVPATVEEPDQI